MRKTKEQENERTTKYTLSVFAFYISEVFFHNLKITEIKHKS